VDQAEVQAAFATRLIEVNERVRFCLT